MKDDWLPIRHSLPSDIHVLRMASKLQTSSYEVVGLLVHFWSWVCANSEDGTLSRLDRDILRTILPRPELVGALIEEGWLIEMANGLSVADFDLWMHRSAKKRLKARERQREARFEENVGPGIEHSSHKCHAQGVTSVTKETHEKRTTETVTETETETEKKSAEIARSADATAPAQTEASKPTRKRPKRKPAANAAPVQRIFDLWDAAWRNTRGESYAFSGGKDGAAFKRCLAHAEGDERLVGERIARLLESPPDTWHAQNASPSLLDSRWSQLATQVPTKEHARLHGWRDGANIIPDREQGEAS